MKKQRFTEEQIIGVLKEQEAGAKAADLCRKHGDFQKATFYNWKAKYGGMEVSEAKRLKALEDENARLKKLLAEQMLDAAHSASFLQKMVGPAAQRDAVTHLKTVMGLSERRACNIISAERKTIRYRKWKCVRNFKIERRLSIDAERWVPVSWILWPVFRAYQAV